MKQKNKSRLLTLATSLFMTVAFLSANGSVEYNAKRKYKIDEYVPELGGYFAGEITDPAGHIKASKYVTPTDNQYNSQKTRSLGSNLIGDIESVWSSYTGKGTKVAIIDDGFDYEHPEYKRSDNSSAILSTSRYYYESGSSYAYKKYSDDPTCIGEDWETDENSWATHGTNTSTTAAAPMNNGGGVGIAPEADILALKIDFSFAAIKGAIEYAISQDVDVINMSLGAYAESFTDGFGDSQTGYSGAATYLNNVCQSAYNNGVIVVAAAGNEATWHKSYPACNTKVVAVGAIGDYTNKGNATKLAEFTNYVGSSQTGEINVDILAPGYVYTATRSGKKDSPTHIYDDTQGTSFSCPIVAGAACLWKQKYPSGTPDQFLSQLQTSADGIGDYASQYVPVSGWYSTLDDVGPSNIANGRLNVAKLLAIDDPYVSTTKSSFDISIGEKRQIELATYNGTITYSSNNESVATVSNTGLITATGAGNTTITVTASKNSKTATATVSVNVAEIVAATAIEFNPKTTTIEVGETYESEPTISVTPSNATRLFLFESEDENIATVDEETGVVTGIKEGTTTINAVAVYGDADDSLTITVEKASTPSYWNKITSTSDLTNGDYLIVYEDDNKAFDGSLTKLDATNNNIGVTITNNKITYDDSTAASKFTINAITGGYSIKSASGYYIGRESSSNGMDTSTTTQYVNTISFNSGNAVINGKYKQLCYNTASDQNRFRYLSSSGNIQLYKSDNVGPTPTVSSVSVSPSSLSLDVYNNKTGNLTATVNGTGSPAQTVTWTSSNTSVATVNSSGVVTAIAKGSATISATSTVDTSKFGSCSVTVTDSTPAKTLSSITISGYKTTLQVNSEFSFGGTVTAHFSDTSESDVTSSATFSGYDMTTVGVYTVTVSYTYNSLTRTATYQLTVSNSQKFSQTFGYSDQGTTWTLTNCKDLTSYWLCPEGSTTSIALMSGIFENKIINSDVKITLNIATYGNGSSPSSNTFKIYNSEECTTQVTAAQSGSLPTSNTYTNAIYTVSQANASNFEDDLAIKITKPGKQIRLKTITVEFDYVDATDKVIGSLTANYSGGNLYVGDSLDESKVFVTANYTDSTKYPSKLLNSSDYTISGFSSESAGEKEVTVTYIGSTSTAETPMTTTFSVQVIEDTIEEVTVSCSTTFHPGETISKSNLIVTLHYQSGKQETTSNYSFEEYKFTYADAPSGGSSSQKQLSITFNSQQYNFTVNVTRATYTEPSSLHTSLGATQFSNSDLSKSSSTASNPNVTIDGIAFTVTTNAYVYNSSYISFGKNAGSIQNTNAFARDLTAVSYEVKSGARDDGTLSISKDGNSWTTYSASEVAKGGYRFFKIAYSSSSSSYSNISKISFTLLGQDNPTNVANYIMFEDTLNQCVTKLDIALKKLNTMSDADKETFNTSIDYVIATARERLEAWAKHEGKQLTFADGLYSISNMNTSSFLSINEDSSLIWIVLLTSFVAITIIGVYVVKRRKHE